MPNNLNAPGMPSSVPANAQASANEAYEKYLKELQAKAKEDAAKKAKTQSEVKPEQPVTQPQKMQKAPLDLVGNYKNAADKKKKAEAETSVKAEETKDPEAEKINKAVQEETEKLKNKEFRMPTQAELQKKQEEFEKLKEQYPKKEEKEEDSFYRYLLDKNLGIEISPEREKKYGWKEKAYKSLGFIGDELVDVMSLASSASQFGKVFNPTTGKYEFKHLSTGPKGLTINGGSSGAPVKPASEKLNFTTHGSSALADDADDVIIDWQGNPHSPNSNSTAELLRRQNGFNTIDIDVNVPKEVKQAEAVLDSIYKAGKENIGLDDLVKELTKQEVDANIIEKFKNVYLENPNFYDTPMEAYNAVVGQAKFDSAMYGSFLGAGKTASEATGIARVHELNDQLQDLARRSEIIKGMNAAINADKVNKPELWIKTLGREAWNTLVWLSRPISNITDRGMNQFLFNAQKKYYADYLLNEGRYLEAAFVNSLDFNTSSSKKFDEFYKMYNEDVGDFKAYMEGRAVVELADKLENGTEEEVNDVVEALNSLPIHNPSDVSRGNYQAETLKRQWEERQKYANEHSSTLGSELDELKSKNNKNKITTADELLELQLSLAEQGLTPDEVNKRIEEMGIDLDAIDYDEDLLQTTVRDTEQTETKPASTSAKGYEPYSATFVTPDGKTRNIKTEVGGQGAGYREGDEFNVTDIIKDPSLYTKNKLNNPTAWQFVGQLKGGNKEKGIEPVPAGIVLQWLKDAEKTLGAGQSLYTPYLTSALEYYYPELSEYINKARAEEQSRNKDVISNADVDATKSENISNANVTSNENISNADVVNTQNKENISSADVSNAENEDIIGSADVDASSKGNEANTNSSTNTATNTATNAEAGVEPGNNTKAKTETPHDETGGGNNGTLPFKVPIFPFIDWSKYDDNDEKLKNAQKELEETVANKPEKVKVFNESILDMFENGFFGGERGPNGEIILFNSDGSRNEAGWEALRYANRMMIDNNADHLRRWAQFIKTGSEGAPDSTYDKVRSEFLKAFGTDVQANVEVPWDIYSTMTKAEQKAVIEGKLASFKNELDKNKFVYELSKKLSLPYEEVKKAAEEGELSKYLLSQKNSLSLSDLIAAGIIQIEDFFKSMSDENLKDFNDISTNKQPVKRNVNGLVSMLSAMKSGVYDDMEDFNEDDIYDAYFAPKEEKTNNKEQLGNFLSKQRIANSIVPQRAQMTQMQG